MAAVPAYKRTNWEDNEVVFFLNLWSDSEVQRQLDGTVRNKNVFPDMAARMAEAGIFTYILKVLFLSIFFVGTADNLSVQLTCLSANMYRQNSEKSIIGAVAPPPPPTGYASALQVSLAAGFDIFD